MVRKKRDEGGRFKKNDSPEEWAIVSWTPDLVKQWSSNPAFRSYCKGIGFEIGEGVSELKTTGTQRTGDLDIADIAKVIAEATARVTAAQALPKVAAAETGTELTKFPEPLTKKVILKDGRTVELDQPLYPINIAGEDYSGTGYYPPDATRLLKKELEGAKWVVIPYNAAFVEYTFHRTNEKGKIEKIKEMFTGPGVYAGKSLASSLEAQVEKLVSHTVIGGPDQPLIPGTKTQYNDLSTNDVRFVPGFTYLIPKHVAFDLERRMREHAESFQRVHQERVSLGKQGLSMYMGAVGTPTGPIPAAAAELRHADGLSPEQSEKIIREGRI